MLNSRRSWLIIGLGVTLLFGLIRSSSAADRQFLHGHVPPAAARLQPLGHLPGTNYLNLAIGLPLRNQAELDELLRQLYDPASPNFHQYLTPEQFTEKFGPTEQEYQAVIAFAEANGLTVTATHGNRLLLDVSGPAANVEKAFEVALQVYKHPTENRTFYAPDAEPSVDSALPILDVSGLDNYRRPHPRNLIVKPSDNATVAVPKAGSGPGGTYLGNDFRAAYAPGVSLRGSGQTVGVVEFDGYYLTDITNYEKRANMTNVPLQNVLLDGFNGTPTTNTDSVGEVSLDIELAVAMAPALAKVIVFEGNPNNFIPNDVLNRMAASNSIKQLSCSWGWNGGPSATTDNIFQAMATEGQSFFNASGDVDAFTTGSGSVNGVDNTSLYNAPSSSPYITQVGGTTLTTTGPGGPWLSEATWNWGLYQGSYAGSSGGISSYYTIPSWQTNINMSANQGSTTMRNIPDVALTADNVWVIYDNGQSNYFGGTSCAAPLWAGFTALINQQAVAKGRATVGFINPAIYAIGKGPAHASSFNDILIGNNTWSSSLTNFYAAPGYDLCTGWGSPNGGSLIIALAAPDGFSIMPGRGLTSGGPAGGPFNVTSQNFSLTNSGATSLNWSLINTSLWVNAAPTSGTLAPGGQAIVTLNLNSAASNLTAGVYTANVWFTNQSSGLAQDRQLTLQVGSLVQNGGFETGDFSFWTLMGSPDNSIDDGAVITPDSGAYAAALGQSGSLGYLYQSLPTLPGQAYLLSLWLDNPRASSRGKPNTFLVQWNGNTIYNSTNLGVLSWTNLQFVVKVASSSNILQFVFRNDPYYFGLDNVSVVPIPAPVFKSVAETNNTFKLTWNVMTGIVYQVQYRTNLIQTNWISLGGAVTATNATMTTFDSNAILSSPQRFYRVILP